MVARQHEEELKSGIGVNKTPTQLTSQQMTMDNWNVNILHL